MDIRGDVMEEEKKKRRFAAWDMKFIMIHVLCSPIIFIRLYMYPGIAVPMWSIGVGIFILAAVVRYVLAAMGLEQKSLEKSGLRHCTGRLVSWEYFSC